LFTTLVEGQLLTMAAVVQELPVMVAVLLHKQTEPQILAAEVAVLGQQAHKVLVALA